MKKKGFTLVELLATIVILSVIALIATPIVLNVIEKSKKSSLVASANGLIESANMYYSNQIINGDITEDTVFDFVEGVQTSDTKLSYKGKVYNGKLILTSSSDVVMCIDDGTYYAYKEQNSDEVISGIGTCLYDGTTGDFTIQSDSEVVQQQCNEDKAKLQEKIDELEEEITDLNNEIAEKESAILALQGSSSAKDSEIATLQGEKQDLQDALDAKNQELSELNTKLSSVTATSSDVLTGKTILASDGTIVTGTMANRTGTTTAASSVSVTSDYIYVTPPAGYYDGTSKISTPKTNSNIGIRNLGSLGTNANISSTSLTIPSSATKMFFVGGGWAITGWFGMYDRSASATTFTTPTWYVRLSDGSLHSNVSTIKIDWPNNKLTITSNSNGNMSYGVYVQ